MHRAIRPSRDVTKEVQPPNLTNAIALVQSHNGSYREITLDLFRALLRQCTYLPDSAARKYWHSHIVSRFRDYCPCQRPGAQPKRQEQSAVITKRIPTLLRDGVKNLRLLIRANDGHPDALQKVLATTYGRRGKRKHELQVFLKARNNPLDQEAWARLSSSFEKKSPIPYLGETMAAVVKSQKGQKVSGFDKKPIKNLMPIIEKENAWGRPMPQNRVANSVKKWYARTLDALLPPLQEHEWNRLGGLATGQVPWTGPVPRRRQTVGRNDHNRIVQQEAKAGVVLEGAKRLKSRCNERSSGVKTNPHKLTPRYMRSLWAKVFVQCPVMKWDDERKRWDVQWGSIQKRKEIVLSPHQQVDMSLFEGVDESGAAVRGS